MPTALKTADTEKLATESAANIGRYLDEAAPFLRSLSQNPQAPMTPSNKQFLANLGAAVFSNIFGFGIPTIVSAAVPKEWQGLTYGATLATTSLANSDLTSAITRHLGGANPSLYLGGEKSAVVGPYKKIGGDTLLTLGNLATYGGINALESLKLTSSWDAVAKSVTSGASMALLMQGLIYYFARQTLENQGVSEAKKLPELDHNRTLQSGVYLKDVPKWSDRTNKAVKTQEVVANAIGSTFGAAAAGAVKHFAPTSHAPLQSFVTIMGGIGAYFAATALGKMAYTMAVDHPGQFANRHAIAASDVAVQHIANSAMNEYEGLLDQIGDEIGEGKWGDTSKTTFDRAFDTFLGKAFRTQPGENAPAHVGKARDFADELDTLRTQLAHHAGDSNVARGTIEKMDRMLHSASQSIRVAAQAAEVGEPINFAMQDVRNRLRDVQALILQSQYQLGGPEGVTADKHVMEAGAKLAPAFAALRQFDRMSAANGFVDKIVQHSVGKASTAEVAAAFAGTGHRNLAVRDVVARLTGRGQSVPEDRQRLNDELTSLLAGSSNDTRPDRSGAKMMILANMIADTSKVDTPPLPADVQAVRTFFQGLQRPAGAAVPDKEMRAQFTDVFKTGGVTARALQAELQRLERLGGDDEDDPTATMVGSFALQPRSQGNDLEARASTPEYRASVKQFREAIGPEFLHALAQETPSLPNGKTTTSGANHAEERVAEMVQAMWHDAESMPEVHRGLMAGAMSLNIHIPELPFYLTHDAHFHPTSYSGRVNSLTHLVDFMNASGVERTNLAGIPSQQRNPRADRKYYANSEEDIYYRDHDRPLMDQYRTLSDDDKKRFDLSMTGFDVTDGNTIGEEMDSRMRTDPGAYAAVGEVTWKKEIVSGKNPRMPDLDSPATMQLLVGAAQRGLPVILHCDRGTPEDKNQYAQKVMENIRTAVKMVNWKGNDILAQKGIDGAPAIKPKFVWAHGAGISRFTAESVDHTRSLDTLLSDKDLKDVLSLDLSWDFIGHDILENVHDSLMRRNLAPELRDGLQNLLKTYKAFAEEGGRADKCDDMGDLNLASVHRVAAENVRQTYFLALQDFKQRLEKALGNNETHKAFQDLLDHHGDQGNNWLHLFNKHQDRLLFGTDALAVGIKAHGDAAYAMNVRVLNPLYMLFDEMGKRAKAEGRPETYSSITGNITLKNYEGVFDNPEVKARRTAYEQYLTTEKKADHSTNRLPDTAAFSVSEVRPQGLRHRLPGGSSNVE